MKERASTVKGIALFITFAFGLFLVVESSYRVYVAGPSALNPLRANSLNTIMRSEFVRLSEYPDIFFELKPDMRGWFRNVPFATNSAGMADIEHPREKPPGVFRVAIAGSSWSMPAGVERADAWHAHLLRTLQEKEGLAQLEFLNFAVEQYGLREIVGTVRHKALAWQPDLIMVAITGVTSSFVWEAADPQQRLPERSYPFLQSYVLSAFGAALGWNGSAPADDRPRLDPDQPAERLNQISRAFSELHDLVADEQIPVVVILLGFYPFADAFEAELLANAAGRGVTVIVANDIFPLDPEQSSPYLLSEFDAHPNASGHEFIAGFVADRLLATGLLPGPGLPAGH